MKSVSPQGTPIARRQNLKTSQVLLNIYVALTLLAACAVAGCRSTACNRPEWAVASCDREVEFESGTGMEAEPRASSEAVTLVSAESLQLASPETIPAGDADENEGSVLRLADVERLALQHNPTLAAAAARLDAAAGRELQAGRLPNPVIGYHGTEIGNQSTAGQQGAFVSQRFVTAGKLRLDQAIASQTTAAAHLGLHAQEQRIVTDVRLRFYETLAAQRRAALAEELVGINDNFVAATEKLVRSRVASRHDLLQAQIEADRSHLLLSNAHNQEVEAWRRLAAVVGVDELTEGPLAGDLETNVPRIEWDEAYGNLLANSPELAVAEARVAQAALTVERVRREPIPNIELMVSHRHHNVTRDDVTNVQVGLPIPIFDKSRGASRAAEAEWLAAKSELARRRFELQDRLASVYRRHENALEQVDLYGERIVPHARESLKLVQTAYESGELDYLALLTAQETYTQVHLAYLDSLLEVRTSAAVIEGQLLSGSLGSSTR